MPAAQGIPITLSDGTTRVLRFNNRALVAIESLTGKTFTQVAARLQEGSFTTVSQLIWGGLLHDNARLKVDTVVDLVETTKLAEYMEAIAKAITMAFGEPEAPAPADGAAEDANTPEGKAVAAS